MNIGGLNLHSLLSQMGIRTDILGKGNLQVAMRQANIAAAIQKPSISSTTQNNATTMSEMQKAMAARFTPLIAAEEMQTQGAQPLYAIKKAGATEKKEGKREVSKEDETDSEDLFGELLDEEKGGGIDADAGGGGSAGEGTFGGGAGQEGTRKAPAQEMVSLLRNLDPKKDLQSQIDEYLKDPAWKTESGQAKVAQFIFEHLKAGETDLQKRVKIYVDKHTEQAVLKSLQKEMAAKGVSLEQQAEIDKKFKQYFTLVATETTIPPDEINFMRELGNSLPGLNSEELKFSFRNQLLHQIGLSMRKLSTFDDRAELMTCNMAIKTPRAINHLEKDFAIAIQRIYKDGLTQLGLYTISE